MPYKKFRLSTAPNAPSLLKMCVIADADRALAIAGVMGGQQSEIGFASRNYIDPVRVV